MSAFRHLLQFITNGDTGAVNELLGVEPTLALIASPSGATRQEYTEYFFPTISRYLYEGDTALHIAAASLSKPIVERLVSLGADPRARNRRGAEPLHYAADADSAEIKAQGEVIEYLVSVGADPNAKDRSGTAPLHKAVRRRSLAACRALLKCGADCRLPNGTGSTPLHLAVQTTGASGSGSAEARDFQVEIIALLIKHGAKPTDRDAKGKQVIQAATGKCLQDLLGKK